MENRTQVRCPENQELATHVWNKWKEMAQQPKGISDNMDMTLSKAHFNVCNSKTPILTIKDFSQVKGVGKMILRLMQGFFAAASGGSEPEDLTKKGKKTKGTKRYMPQRNSVAYALLITLYRGTSNGNEFMRKQELIDAAEASGLSRVPIAPEKGKGKPVHFGSSPRDWYSGWNCMKTLIAKGLVVKSSCPAKYMLTQEGKEAARDCLARSGKAESLEKSASADIPSCTDNQNSLDVELNGHDLESEVLSPLTLQKKSVDVPLDCLERMEGKLAEELYAESLELSKLEFTCTSANDQENNPNDCDDYNLSLWDDSDDKLDSSSDMNREWQRRHDQFHTIGYRDGLIAGKEAAAQEGFNSGFKQSVLDGYSFGAVRGVTSAFTHLPHQLKERLIEKQEKRNEFQVLYESVHSLSTTDALILFSEDIKAQKDLEENTAVLQELLSHGSKLKNYRGQLESLIHDSPAIDIRLPEPK